MVALSVLIATAPTDNPDKAVIADALFTTLTDVIENAGNWAVGTFPSEPKLATPLVAPIKELLIFVFKEACVKALIGLLISLVLSTLSKPKLVLKPAIVDAPVPPFTIETIPVILVAVPNKLPLNAPFASRFTILFAKFELVALFANIVAAAISSFVLPPTLKTKGAAPVPPRSPANNILPLLVVVASATELVIDPDASANALATYSVVANFVLLSLRDCVTPVAPVGNTGSPVNVGEFKFAFRSNAACCAVLTGLLASLVLSTFPIPKFVLALTLVVAPVPPLTTATMPETFVAFPVTVPIRFPVIFPITFPVTFPIKLEEMVPALKSPFASRFTKAFAKLLDVPFPKATTVAAILSLVFPPTFITRGFAAVPPKSPANNILPFAVVVASATEFVIEPEASESAFAT